MDTINFILIFFTFASNLGILAFLLRISYVLVKFYENYQKRSRRADKAARLAMEKARKVAAATGLVDIER